MSGDRSTGRPRLSGGSSRPEGPGGWTPHPAGGLNEFEEQGGAQAGGRAAGPAARSGESGPGRGQGGAGGGESRGAGGSRLSGGSNRARGPEGWIPHPAGALNEHDHEEVERAASAGGAERSRGAAAPPPPEPAAEPGGQVSRGAGGSRLSGGSNRARGSGGWIPHPAGGLNEHDREEVERAASPGGAERSRATAAPPPPESRAEPGGQVSRGAGGSRLSGGGNRARGPEGWVPHPAGGLNEQDRDEVERARRQGGGGVSGYVRGWEGGADEGGTALADAPAGHEAWEEEPPAGPSRGGVRWPQAAGRVARGDISGSVAVEQLLARGVDVPRLVETLIGAAASELTTYYYYTLLRVWLAGHEDYKGVAEDARLEDRSHFELILPRIYELGGDLPHDLREFADRSGCGDAFLPDPPTAENILVVMLEAERCAIRTWAAVCDLTAGKDPRTYDMAARILQEEVEHEAWFIELLAHERGEGPRPSGHFARSGSLAPHSRNLPFYNP